MLLAAISPTLMEEIRTYQQIDDHLFPTRHAAQAANDAALTSAVLLVAADFDQTPPTSKEAALTKLTAILGDTYAGRPIRHVIRI